MEPVINQIHELLIKKDKTIAVAESCTGGLVSEFLSRIPGSSKYFILGLVTYSNQAKENILGIPKSTIIKYGAVSKETAGLMARKARLLAKSDFGIGVTGIAGPGGATKEKPVGTVFIALSVKNKLYCKKCCFKGNRTAIRNAAAIESLNLLNNFLRNT